MTRKSWYDVDSRGRKLNAIWWDCNTKYWKNVDTSPELAQSYFNRMMIIEKLLQPYIEQVTGVKKFLKEGKANEADILR